LQNNPKHHEFLNNSIVNYTQLKTTFTPIFFTEEQLYQLHLLFKALNFIADNKVECAEYGASMEEEDLATLAVCLAVLLCSSSWCPVRSRSAEEIVYILGGDLASLH
jgi:hypothetical protein